MIGFGCVKLTSHSTQQEALSVLKCAFDNGIRWFDTAPLYGQGYSERILGNFIKSLSNTDKYELKVVTKFGLGIPKENFIPSRLALPLNYVKSKIKGAHISNIHSSVHPQIRKINLDYIEKQFHLSQKRIGVEEFHGYLGHEMSPNWLSDEALFFLHTKKAEGLIRNLGIGTSATFLLENEKSINQSDFNLLQFSFDNLKSFKIIQETFSQSKLSSYGFFSVSDSFSGIDNIKTIQTEYPETTLLFSTSKKARLIANIKSITQ